MPRPRIAISGRITGQGAPYRFIVLEIPRGNPCKAHALQGWGQRPRSRGIRQGRRRRSILLAAAVLPCFGKVAKAGELRLEAEFDRADGTVTLLADDHLGLAI